MEEGRKGVDKVAIGGWTPLMNEKRKGHEGLVNYLKGKGVKD